jgi:hypothetical protein
LTTVSRVPEATTRREVLRFVDDGPGVSVDSPLALRVEEGRENFCAAVRAILET